MSSLDVPVIDISPYLVPGATAATSKACARVAHQLDMACRGTGFMQVIGHRVSEEAVAGLADALDDFFARPLEDKKAYRRPAGANRGYAPPKSESLSMSLGVASANKMNDFYEAFTIGSEANWYPGRGLPETSYASNTWPAEVAGFQNRIEAYFAEVTVLSRVLLTAFADALGVDPSFFEQMTDASIDVLKMNNYTLPEGEIDLAGELMGMGAHTDFGILTVLWADRVEGLQVLGSDGAWHDVMPDEGAFLINLGDAMARWTNDAWKSTLHRVNPPVVNGRIKRRRSAAFFLDGNHDAIIEPLPGCIVDGQATYPPITVAENIAAKIAGFKLGKAPAMADREAARVRAAG